jgi:tRNA dimethylallyltransferase
VSQSLHRIITIAGPTAVGKTDLAIAVATHLQVPILSFDSRQCYRELCIGVARPTAEQLQLVPHFFIADHSIEEPVSAAYYESYAAKKVASLIAQYGQVVMVGGTGLYWKAFWEGLDEIPAVDPSVRAAIAEQYQQEGMQWLEQTLAALDPEYAAAGEMLNPQRMMRALEVVRSTGKSILFFQKGRVKQQPYMVKGIGLQLPRAELDRRIERRVDLMMEQGLLEEVRTLEKYKNLNALNTVGYKELFEYFKEDISLPQALQQIKLHTRQYAKRQLTWFKKDPLFQWFEPGQKDKILASL